MSKKFLPLCLTAALATVAGCQYVDQSDAYCIKEGETTSPTGETVHTYGIYQAKGAEIKLHEISGIFKIGRSGTATLSDDGNNTVNLSKGVCTFRGENAVFIYELVAEKPSPADVKL